MTGSHQDTLSVSSLEEGARENTCGDNLLLQSRHEVDHGAASVQNLGVRLSEETLFRIPLGSFDVHSNDMDSIFGGGDTLAIIRHIMDNLEVITKGINSDGVLSGIVLHSTGQETMGEEELVDPEAFGNTASDPFVEELKSFFKILDVTTERLERRETLGDPHSGDLTIRHCDHSVFKVVRHENFSNNGTLHVLQTRLDSLDEQVETSELLGEHGVHGLVVIDRVVLLSLSDVVLFRHVLNDTVGQSDDNSFLISVSTTSTSLHRRQNSSKSIVSLVNFLGDGCVSVHSEDFRLGELRERVTVSRVFIIVTSGSDFRREVETRRTELVSIHKGVVANVSLEQAHEGDTILAISYSTSIIALTNTVVNSIEGSLVGVLVDEDVELLGGNTEIRLIELITVSPSEGTIQSTLLDDSVEEE